MKLKLFLLLFPATIIFTSYDWQSNSATPNNLNACTASCHNSLEQPYFKDTKVLIIGKPSYDYYKPDSLYKLEVIVTNYKMTGGDKRKANINVFATTGELSYADDETLHKNNGSKSEFVSKSHPFSPSSMLYSTPKIIANDTARWIVYWKAPKYGKSARMPDIGVETFVTNADNTAKGEEFVWATN